MSSPSPRARRVVVATVALVVVAVAAVGGACSKPAPGSPGAAYESVVAALEGGDNDALYALLSEELQEQLRRVHEAASEAVSLIDASYPPQSRAAARAAAGAELLARVDGPAALFRELSAGRTNSALSTLQRLGSSVAATSTQGDVAQVRTRGGDVWDFRQAADGSWRWIPPEPDRRIVADALARVEANLAAVRDNVRQMELLRARGIVRALPFDAIAPHAPSDAAEPAADAAAPASPAGDAGAAPAADTPPGAGPTGAGTPPDAGAATDGGAPSGS